MGSHEMFHLELRSCKLFASVGFMYYLIYIDWSYSDSEMADNLKIRI